MYTKHKGFAANCSGGKPHDPIVSKKALEAWLDKHSQPLKLAVKHNERQQIAEILRTRSAEVAEKKFRQYLLDLAEALDTAQWDKIGHHFVDKSFIDNEIAFLLAPYRRRIDGQDVTQLTLLVGQVSSYVPERMEKSAIKIFGQLNQRIPELLVIDVLASEGNVGGDDAFVAPGGWVMPKSERGAAILALNLHIRRYDRSIRRRIQRIFEEKTAKLLFSAIADHQAIVQEYYLHEAGHSLGLGLDLKNQLRLVNTPQHAGSEEWKTDIGGFRLGAEVFSPEVAGKLIACTLLIRWGVDFCRPGAPLNDHDAMASLYLLDRLLPSGEIYLTSNRLLALRDASFEGLFRATEIHRLEAEELVREELDRLDEPTSILAFYDGKIAHPDTIALHQEFIDRCRDLSL